MVPPYKVLLSRLQTERVHFARLHVTRPLRRAALTRPLRRAASLRRKDGAPSGTLLPGGVVRVPFTEDAQAIGTDAQHRRMWREVRYLAAY